MNQGNIEEAKNIIEQEFIQRVEYDTDEYEVEDLYRIRLL